MLFSTTQDAQWSLPNYIVNNIGLELSTPLMIQMLRFLCPLLLLLYVIIMPRVTFTDGCSEILSDIGSPMGFCKNVF